MPDDHPTRRDLLAAAGAVTLGGALSALAAEDAAADRIDPDAADGRDPVFDIEREESSVFPQSVASGGPTASGVLLWTRIDPDAHDASNSDTPTASSSDASTRTTGTTDTTGSDTTTSNAATTDANNSDTPTTDASNSDTTTDTSNSNTTTDANAPTADVNIFSADTNTSTDASTSTADASTSTVADTNTPTADTNTSTDADTPTADTKLGVEVASDEAFEDVVYRGTVPAERIGPESDYAVTVDLDGELAADERYFYRFVYDGDASRVGRCRTLPRPDASPESLRLALASCNDYLDGYFGAFAHLAEEDADFLVHLGDFIYAYGGDGPGDRSIELPSGNRLAAGLDDYRHLYRTYRSDEHLQRALERHTLIHTWDDNEIANDRWWNYETGAPQSGSHPQGDDPAFMRQLYVDGIRAYTEHVPVRVRYEPEGSGGGDDRDGTAGRELPADDLHDAFRLYRSFRFGDLAELFVTDERLYRSRPPGADESGIAVAASKADDDPGRTILGDDQREWFLDGVTDSSARWKLWGNEVLAAAFRFLDDGTVAVNADAWDGYRTERERILSAVSDAGVENLVTLTGDMHSYLAAYLHDGFEVSSQALGDADRGDRVGVEFMAPAVSSDNLVSSGQLPDSDALVGALQVENPHVEWFDSSHWGYAVVEMDRDELRYSAYAVDRSVDSADAPRRLLRRYRVPAGEVALERVDGDG